MHLPIFGDPMLGYADVVVPEDDDTNTPDRSYVDKWPAGYWSTYDDLRQTAMDVASVRTLWVVVCFNGYRVYAVGRCTLHGPVRGDRHEALRAFIAEHSHDGNTKKHRRVS